MKTIILIILSSIYYTNVNAQEIQATTSAGKKVILNVKDNTWKWANPQDGEKPCITNYTANIYIHNNTKQDIYFYYSNTFYRKIEFLKIKAGEHRLVEDLYTKQGQWKNILNYNWKVSYELYEIRDFADIKSFQGFDSGTFILNECETRDIKIYD